MLKVSQMQSIPCPVKAVDKKLLHFVMNAPCKSENELWDRSRVIKDLEAKSAADDASKKFPTFRR
jgi:hypothetical protein